jgi:hypothetical protein
VPPIRKRRPQIDAEIAAREAAVEAFDDPAVWRRSAKGNLWRNWEGLTVSIFRRTGDDLFGWCIADGDGRRFSPGGYETEDDALSGLHDALEVGGSW